MYDIESIKALYKGKALNLLNNLKYEKKNAIYISVILNLLY